MKQVKLSVVLATHNEQANLSRCLESVKALADEIVVVDGRSSDATVVIAKSFDARVFVVPNPLNFHLNKNIAIDKARGDWIFQLDADELVSPELASEIADVIRMDTSLVGFWMSRKNWFLNRFLTKGGQYPDPTLRLYKKNFGRLPAVDVHEQAVVTGATGYLQHDLLHYRYTSMEQYLDRFNLYSTFISLQMAEQNLPISIGQAVNHLITKPLTIFLTIYFRHRGYVDGLPGFTFALYSGLIYPVAYIKYWQHINYPA